MFLNSVVAGSMGDLTRVRLDREPDIAVSRWRRTEHYSISLDTNDAFAHRQPVAQGGVSDAGLDEG